MTEVMLAVLLIVVPIQLYRLEQVLQSVCRNQVMTAKLLGKAHGIPIVDNMP